VEREPFRLRCLAAVCGCAPGRDCLCAVLSAYAHRCAQEGTPLHWRNQTLCRESPHLSSPNPGSFSTPSPSLLLFLFFYFCGIS
jgi:hypothetical protein